MKRTLTFVAATLVLSACSTVRSLPFPNFGRAPVAGPLLPPTPAADAYLRAAGESDLFEVTSSQLALQRTQNVDIRRFAAAMVEHHTTTTNTLLAAAKAAGVAPPPAVLGPQKRAMIDQLNLQAGFGFDRLYVEQQVAAHREALAIHDAYARGGDVPQLRRTAGITAPIVQRHLSGAERLHARIGPAPM